MLLSIYWRNEKINMMDITIKNLDTVPKSVSEIGE